MATDPTLPLFRFIAPLRHFEMGHLDAVSHQFGTGFAAIPHHDRFFSPMSRRFAPLMVLPHSLSGDNRGIDFAASSGLAVCRHRRIRRYTLWQPRRMRQDQHGVFHGLKPPSVINPKDPVVAPKIIPGNIADSPVLDEMTRPLGRGQLDAGTGYIATNCSDAGGVAGISSPVAAGP